MLSTLNDWTQALKHKIDVDVIYFDFMKAFDKVPSKRLVSKLIELGVHPRVTNWIKKFITDRSFQVRINESFSESLRMTSGGGVLSSIFLFSVYTSEIPSLVNLVSHVKCLLMI